MNPTDLLSLPTDSLYKFLALSGLVITIIAFILPELLKKNYSFNVYKIRMVLDITTEKEKDFKRRAAIYNEKQNKTQEEIECYENESLNNRCKRIEIERYVKELEYLLEKIKIIDFVQILFIFSGVFMFLSGFYLWYTKIQVYLDAAIQQSI